MNNTRLVSFFLRIGLATVFLYAAIAGFLAPDAWVNFLPLWMRNVVDPRLLLAGFGIYEIVLSLALLADKGTKYAALLSAATMAAIVVQNYQAMDVVFRDVAIMFSAFALWALAKNQQ